MEQDYSALDMGIFIKENFIEEINNCIKQGFNMQEFRAMQESMVNLMKNIRNNPSFVRKAGGF